MTANFNEEMLFGLSDRHLLKTDDGHLLEKETLAAFNLMKKAAGDAGFELKIASSFRSFDRQMAIWNNKFNGNRVILDSQNQPVDITKLNDWQKCQAILLFSALPGASRHHWGSDFDYYDAANRPKDYDLQLIDEEYCDGGPFSGLYHWLLDNASQFGFFFPYKTFQGGVAAEPWHLSYEPTASRLMSKMTTEGLTQKLLDSDIAGKEVIGAHIEDIFGQYITNICPGSDKEKASEKKQ